MLHEDVRQMNTTTRLPEMFLIAPPACDCKAFIRKVSKLVKDHEAGQVNPWQAERREWFFETAKEKGLI